MTPTVPAGDLIDPADRPEDWTAALATGERRVYSPPKQPVDPDMESLPVSADEYGLTAAVNDLQAFLGPLEPSGDRPELSNPYIEISKVVRTINRFWSDVPKARQTQILDLLGVSADEAPSRLRSLKSRPAQSTRPSCTPWQDRIEVVKAKLAGLGVERLPPYKVTCYTKKETAAIKDPKVRGAYAYAVPEGFFDNQINTCQIVILPLAETSSKWSTAAHEYWHCVEGFHVPGNTDIFEKTKDWAVEGQAEYVGWTFDKSDTGSWDNYLNSPGYTPLVKRSYDAAGFYIQLHHTLPGGRSDLIPLLAESWASAPDDQAMFGVVTRGNRSFRATWASSRSLADEGKWGDGWDTEPGYSASFRQVAAAEMTPSKNPLYFDAAEFGTLGGRAHFSDEVDVVAVNVTHGWGRVTDKSGGGTTNTSPNYFIAGSTTLCGPGQTEEPEPCVCPGLPDLPPPPPIAPDNELQLAVAGDSNGGELALYALTLEDYCEAKGQKSTPPKQGECRYLGAGDLDRFAREASIFDNRETGTENDLICQVAYYPLSFEGESRSLDLYLLISTTRPPVLAGKKMPVPVPALGKVASRDPANPDGYGRFGQGELSSGSAALFFKCGKKYCSLVLSIVDRPPTADIRPIQDIAVEIAKIVKKRVR